MRSKVLWAGLIFLLPALACSLGGGSESASSNVSLGGEATEAPTATQPPVEEDIEQTQSETPTPEPAQPESQPLDATLGLDQLDSYRADITLEFSGARGESTGDQTTTQQQDILLEVTNDPLVWHQVTQIKSEGAVETDVESEYYYVDDVTYTHTFGNWIAQAGLIGRSQFSSPGLYTPVPETATCDSEPEEVNGISTIHCTFTKEDNVANSLEGADTIQGDIWLAEDGDYVVKYQLAAQDLQLKGAFTGGYEEFETYNLSYELSDVNSDLSLELPAEAQDTEIIDVSGADDGSSGLSAPESADLFLDSSAGLNYFSTAELSDLVDFHQENLTAAGWQELTDESYVDDDYALLVFEDEEGILRVFLQRDLSGEGYFVSMTLPFDAPGLGSGDSSGGDTSGGSSGDSAAGGSDLPVLDDSSNLFTTDQVTTYYTASDIPAVVDFYRNELPAQDWVENTTTSFSDDNTALLTFEKDGATLTVAINKESEGRVNVNLIRQ